MTTISARHRQGSFVHSHAYSSTHRHLFAPQTSVAIDAQSDRVQLDHVHERGREHTHQHDAGHGHSHGLVDPTIVRSRGGIRAVSLSFVALGLAAAIQAAVYVVSGSVALLADLIHNVGDAMTAVPLAIAFLLRSGRAERWAGLAVVLAIFISAGVALYETIVRLIHPQDLSHLPVLAAAGVVGFAGNEVAAHIRLRAGRRLNSPALVADGNHARVDALVSLGVVVSALIVALGAEIGDPIVGLLITLVILKITWDSWQTVRHSRGAWD